MIGKNAIAQFPNASRALLSSVINILHQENSSRLTEVSGRLTATGPDMSKPMSEEDQEDKPHPFLIWQSAIRQLPMILKARF